ncbi:hypothetical protein LBMAG53_31230 [Planctomycetota bacterium]|nr:hypothetical protein LBMAG53_31230 [Planctomycetota bacterium]
MTMANPKRSDHSFLISLIVSAVIMVSVILGIFCFPQVLDLLGHGQSSEIRLSPAEVKETQDGLRASYRVKWLDGSTRIAPIRDQVMRLRAEAFQQVTADSQLGPAYLDSLIARSATRHIAMPPLGVPRADTIHDAYLKMREIELEIVNAAFDIYAARNALLSHRDVAEAVDLVKVVPPQRIDPGRTALLTDARSLKDPAMAAFRAAIRTGLEEVDLMSKHAQGSLDRLVASNVRRGGDLDIEGAFIFGSASGESLHPDDLVQDVANQEPAPEGLPGRIMQGKPGTWMYLDKWYVLGPFENKRRVNLDTSFQPEVVINLDEQVLGKDGRKLNWEYWFRRKQRIEPLWAPNNCIYYGWTEVHVPKAGKYFVAAGSDDYGKLWINGKLVWKSSTRAKPFRPDEHVAEYDFKEGLNEILFRCENQFGTMGWSVMIAPPAPGT